MSARRYWATEVPKLRRNLQSEDWRDAGRQQREYRDAMGVLMLIVPEHWYYLEQLYIWPS